MDIGNHTNSIVMDFFNATGRIEDRSLLTPQEYLMFRQQAVSEIKQGIKTGEAENALKPPLASDIKPLQRPQVSNTEKTPEATPATQPNEARLPEEVPIKENKITPITTKKKNSQDDRMLAIMKSIDG